jgi:hypothetical protein
MGAGTRAEEADAEQAADAEWEPNDVIAAAAQGAADNAGWTVWVEKLGLALAAVGCMVMGVLRAVTIPQRERAFDRETLLYFVAAGVVVLLNRVKRISFGDKSVDFMEQAKKLERAIHKQTILAEGIGGKAPPALPASGRAASVSPAPVEGAADGVNPEDPNKGAFGGQPARDDRMLEASVRPLKSAPGLYRVRLSARSTDARHPLKGRVTFFLHPTFARPIETVPAPNGMATIFRTAYGAFTVGAEVREPHRAVTRLELDLAELKEAPEEFRIG